MSAGFVGVVCSLAKKFPGAALLLRWFWAFGVSERLAGVVPSSGQRFLQALEGFGWQNQLPRDRKSAKLRLGFGQAKPLAKLSESHRKCKVGVLACKILLAVALSKVQSQRSALRAKSQGCWCSCPTQRAADTASPWARCGGWSGKVGFPSRGEGRRRRAADAIVGLENLYHFAPKR
jgi:hypothetical protein